MNETTTNSVIPQIELPKLITKRGRKNAHSPGRPTKFVPQVHQLTDERFMSRSQREAHKLGIEIWV